MRTLDLIAAGEPPAFAEQDEAGVTYAEKIGPEDRLLDPARPASELERVVRALHPHIGARVALADGTLLGVHRARVAAERTAGGKLTRRGGAAAVRDVRSRAGAARGSAPGRSADGRGRLSARSGNCSLKGLPAAALTLRFGTVPG